MNITRYEQALLHGAKVLIYQLGSIFLVGVAVYIWNNEVVPAWFLNALVHYGLSVSMVNVIWAALTKYIEAKLPPIPVPTGTAVQPPIQPNDVV